MKSDSPNQKGKWVSKAERMRGGAMMSEKKMKKNV